MSETKDGGSAFPHQECRLNFLDVGGMSLRDYFAAKALGIAQGAENIAPTFFTGEETPTYRGIATRAYMIADAMLRAREAKS